MAGLQLQHQQQQQPSIWAQMSYTPPRGPCSLKTSIVSTCTCYRFMVHPSKASTSFSCDGCGHHASFHRMESRAEEEVVRRWEEEERREGLDGGRGMGTVFGPAGREGVAMMVEERFVVGAPKKRRRMIGGGGGGERERDVVEVLEGDAGETATTGGRKRKGRA